VVGNERLTGLSGALLLDLIVVDLVTVPCLHAILSAWLFYTSYAADELLLLAVAERVSLYKQQSLS